MNHKKQGYRFKNDWPLETLETEVLGPFKAAATIPVKVQIKAEHYVLNLENVRQILQGARIISVMDCACRTIYGHCDAPLNVCLDLNELAERHMAEFGARQITLEEALEILEQTHEAGLVHMALGLGEFYEPGAVNSVCSCCSCCCGLLSAILRYGLAPELLKSQAIAVTDSSSCPGCGECVDRCQFGAREMVNGSLSFDQELCFGCGLCVSTCPTHAIALVDK